MAGGEGLDQDLGYFVLNPALSQIKSPFEMFENFQNQKLRGICSASCMKGNVETPWGKVEADRNTTHKELLVSDLNRIVQQEGHSWLMA